MQHARRNFFAGTAIMIGLVAILFLIGYSTRVDNYLGISAMYIQQPGHIAVMKKNGLRHRIIDPKKFSLSAAEVTKVGQYVASHSEFDFLSPYLFGVGLIGSGCKSYPFLATGSDFKKEKLVRDHWELKATIPEFGALIRGIPLWDSVDQGPIALSRGLIKRLGKSLTAHPTQPPKAFNADDCINATARLSEDPNVQLLSQDYDGRLSAVDSTVVNEFSTGAALTENSSIRMSITQLQELLRTDNVSYLGLFLKDRSQANESAVKLVRDLAADGLEIEAYAWNDELWNPDFFAGRNVLIVSQIFVSVVVAMVVLLSILNTVNIGLVESRVEIGTLRALGYKPRQVAWIFAIEALVVAILSVVIGMALGFALFSLIDWLRVPMQFPGASELSTFRITPPLWSYFASACALTVLVVITSFIIARRYAGQPTLTLLDRGS